MKGIAVAAAIAAGFAALALWALCAVAGELEDYRDPCQWPVDGGETDAD